MPSELQRFFASRHEAGQRQEVPGGSRDGRWVQATEVGCKWFFKLGSQESPELFWLFRIQWGFPFDPLKVELLAGI